MSKWLGIVNSLPFFLPATLAPTEWFKERSFHDHSATVRRLHFVTNRFFETLTNGKYLNELIRLLILYGLMRANNICSTSGSRRSGRFNQKVSQCILYVSNVTYYSTTQRISHIFVLMLLYKVEFKDCLKFCLTALVAKLS